MTASPLAAERFFVFRLLPPRPTFPADMTAEEREIMRAHSAYLRDGMARGKLIIFGPVADPKGVWGLGVVRAADQAEAEALAAADPVIQADRGFRYEILPMIQAVTAG
jgi:uncharacterized protein YciI